MSTKRCGAPCCSGQAPPPTRAPQPPPRRPRQQAHSGTGQHPAAVALLAAGAGAAGGLQAAAVQAAEAATELAAAAAPGSAAGYVPTPIELGWEIWVGAAAGVLPFLVASYEFGKRILIQRRCSTCQGRGLVQKGRYLRKCTECGGLLPWLGWKYFFLSTAAPGNGGPVMAPKGQTSVFYKVPPRPAPAAAAQGETPPNSDATAPAASGSTESAERGSTSD